MTDTITLPRSVIEQAIESLQGYARETGDTQPCDAEKALRSALAQQAEQGWIDASKQMPPAQVRVLGFEPQYNIVDVDMWFGPDFQWGYSYWMPLPTPPKGGI